MAGYILFRRDGDLLDVLRLGVHPDHAHQGLGRSLLERALSVTDRAVLTVKKDNIRALRLYTHAGFEIVGHLQSAHAWVMLWRKPLTSVGS